MTYTVNQLIVEAYNLANIVAPEYETVGGDESSLGLRLLNELISYKSVQQKYIPYWTEYEFNAVVNQEMYFIPNLIRAETLTFNINDIRYQMFPLDRKRYFGTGRIDTISSLPYNWRLERTLGGANVYLYFLPADTYPMKLWGKFSLATVTKFQDLSLTLDLYYITYLRYLLAEYLCCEYSITFQPQQRQKLKELEIQIMELSPQDMMIQKMSSLQKDTSINYADVNIGRGWRPS